MCLQLHKQQATNSYRRSACASSADLVSCMGVKVIGRPRTTFPLFARANRELDTARELEKGGFRLRIHVYMYVYTNER